MVEGIVKNVNIFVYILEIMYSILVGIINFDDF